MLAERPHVGEQRWLDVAYRIRAERLRENAPARRVVVLVDRRHDHGHLEEVAKGRVELGLLRVGLGAVDVAQDGAAVDGDLVGAEADDWACFSAVLVSGGYSGVRFLDVGGWQTIFAVESVEVEVAVTEPAVVDCVEAGRSSQDWTWVLGEWVDE